jgi:L-arabinose isomerase
MRNLLVLILVCKIFVLGAGNNNAVEKNITDWLKNKRLISMSQSTNPQIGFLGENYITIIADNDKSEE